jgi:hypothetical protein
MIDRVLKLLGLKTREQLVVAVLLAYCALITVLRLVPTLQPWVAETDWKQWVWQYHRYHEDGAFPPGHVINDYVFLTQPPFYWAWMAAFSTIFTPIHAAVLLNVVSFVGALAGAYLVVKEKTRPVFGALAAALLARDDVFHRITVGGYPRSFGPTLTLLFLWAWMSGRRRLVLALFIVMAGLYPSVVVPTALAYGLWSVFLSGKDRWWRRNLELAATGVVVIVLAELQSLQAPAWWGKVVGLAEAKTMPALGPHGRFTWLPFESFWPKATSYLLQPFGRSGGLDHANLLLPQGVLRALFGVLFAMLLLVALGIAKRKSKPLEVPLAPFLVVATALFSYFLARVLAFQLYLPHRMVQHTLPYVAVVLFVLLLVAAARAMFEDDKRVNLAVAGVALSVFVLCGDGVWAPGLRSYAKDAPLYTWLHDHTKHTDQFAGSLAVLDEIPLFASRQMYVNWKMAHPVRRGYYDEMERRIRAMMDATYATTKEQVLAFAEKEKIDYFIVDHRVFDEVEESLFEPIRKDVVKMQKQRKAQGFFLEHVPADAIVFHHGDYDVVDLKRLE